MVATVVRAFQLFTVPYANGWDGAFYQMQLQHWLETGHLHTQNFSLIYILLKPLTLLSNPLTAYKSIAVLTSAFFSALVFSFAKKHTNVKIAYLVALYSIASPFVLFFSHQFTKNMLGIDAVLLFLISDNKKTQLIIAFVLAAISHRIALAIIIFHIILNLLFKLKLKRTMLVILAAVALIPLIGFIPGFPNVFDYLRVVADFDMSLYFAPIKFLKVWDIDTQLWYWYVETGIFIGTIAAGTILLWKNKTIRPAIIIIISLLIPFFEFNSGSMGYRLFLNAVLLSFIIMPFLLAKIKCHSLIIAITILIFSFNEYRHDKFDPPIHLYEAIANKAITHINKKSTDKTLIIAHKGLKEQIIMQSHHDALNWQPDSTASETATYRITHGVTDAEIITLQGKHQSEWIKLYNHYHLTTEENWQNLLIALQEEGMNERIKNIKTWQNPHEIRPAYLR